MTGHRLCPVAPGPLVDYAARFDDPFGRLAPAVQRLQFFLSESRLDPGQVNARRLELLRADPATAPQLQALMNSVAAGCSLHLYILS